MGKNTNLSAGNESKSSDSIDFGGARALFIDIQDEPNGNGTGAKPLQIPKLKTVHLHEANTGPKPLHIPILKTVHLHEANESDSDVD